MMRAVGLITEYNPFHNGHRYHVEQARRVSGAEVVVAVMSGHFLQRGEPALLDKWTRAAMALHSGVDVVVELPFPLACNSAPLFARGGVEVLSSFGPSLDSLCFGSESGQLEPLQLLAQRWEQLDAELSGTHHARRGQTFPQARSQALAEQGDQIPGQDQPNTILGVAYLRALTRLNSSLQPLTIQRRGAQYHDRRPGSGAIASATAIRCLLAEQQPVDGYLPPTALPLLQQAVSEERVLCGQRWFQMVLQACLQEPAQLAGAYQLEPGLAERIFQAALTAPNYDQLVDAVKARHLTRTRIQRLLVYLVTDLSAALVNDLATGGIPYLQLLGATPRGEAYLAQCRKTLQRPLIGNFSRIRPQLRRYYGDGSDQLSVALRLVAAEDRATRLYSLLLPGWRHGSRQWNYLQPPLRVEPRS